jgi:hypothetical protein
MLLGKTACALLGLLFTASLLQAAESYEVTTAGVTATMRDGVILRADIYRPKVDEPIPVLLQRTPYNKSGGVALASRRQPEDTSRSSFRTCVAATLPKASGTPSNMNPMTATTRLSGRQPCPIQTARSGCGVGRMWALRRCWQRSLIRRTWRASVPWLPPAIITKTGPTRGSHSSNCSTSRGRRAAQDTQSQCQQYQCSWRNVETAAGQLSPVQFF